jgi:hypothetical protein
VEVKIDALPLHPDTYTLDIGCRLGEFGLLDFVPSALQLEVLAGPTTPNSLNHYSAQRAPQQEGGDSPSSPFA